MPSVDRPRPYLSLWFSGAFLLIALLVWALLPAEQVMALVIEGGPIEMPSALLYFAAAIALWFMRRRSMPVALALALTVMFCAFGARELDLHKAWSGASVLKVSYYLRPTVPLQHKLVALAVLLPVIASGFYLLLRWAKPVWQGLRARHPVAVTVVVFFATMAVAKVVDRSQNVLLEDYGIAFTASQEALRASVEEFLELGLGVLAFLGLWQHRRLG
ncbi:hypothetical protein [Caldimonas thermodepolymerans]|jgi:hypothetical protein|uniref:Uncharacterized protein n=1 Tax=Caldimonas thermodepolymerans TaxID=215580 RepID=A0AA46HVZ8_9BURK|nr:hypothetical protein [Caldimonas thermodepolymerans]TCP07563.1 hypothetical protein EV676_104118 [Caldimonas thermodepolymerans]UZG44068.1 hypothetical protein ONZ46_17060 [Caldimonas thermodepolymerans]UZG47734.1 hypothetical protein ONS87_17720 [Caldimonas thermodepolymerans]